MPMLNATHEVNRRQRELAIMKLESELGALKDRTIGFLGLSFKPLTDDLRDSPSLDIISHLSQKGVRVRAHDPVAMGPAKAALNGWDITFCESSQEVMWGADAVVLVTEWPEYQNIIWEGVLKKMKNPLIIDGRNFLDRKKLTQMGFKYVGFGK
jgi:UDPglucose 6-dehydrogenase